MWPLSKLPTIQTSKINTMLIWLYIRQQPAISNSLQGKRQLSLQGTSQCSGHLNKVNQNNLGTRWEMFKVEEIITLIKATSRVDNNITKEVGKARVLIMELKVTRAGVEANNNKLKVDGAKNKAGEE